MSDYTDIYRTDLERAESIENILIAQATGGSSDNDVYKNLRQSLMANPTFNDLLPEFVKKYRNLDAFWAYIKNKESTYALRRIIIHEGFYPLINHLERRNSTPADQVSSDMLQNFDADGVHAVWTKAIDRRISDPEGAITIARTLLETVLKGILDKSNELYSDTDDLPKLYRAAAKVLKLAPNQHTEKPIKEILGGAMNLVNGIGTLRNRLSDSHGRGGRLPVRPSTRHASLAVNTAGAVATFLIETFNERSQN